MRMIGLLVAANLWTATAAGQDLYMDRLADGQRQAVDGRYDEAVQALRAAINLDGSRAEAHVALASVHRLQGNLTAALESFTTAARLSESASLTRARAIYGVADTLERLAITRAEGAPVRVDLDALTRAREAWSELVDFATRHGDVMPLETARARQAVVDQVLAQEARYGAVRERIAERESEAASTSAP